MNHDHFLADPGQRPPPARRAGLIACFRWIGALMAGALAAFAIQAQPLPPADPANGTTFRALVFHDVRYDVLASFSDDPDESAVDASVLAGLFDWMRRNDYHPVSLQQVIDARAGRAPLPARAVLLTFDDGYASFYTRVFPLLKAYNYPAVMALVTSWMEASPTGQVSYGNASVPRSRFLSWAQAREMAQSGLVELVSHSHDLHRGIPSNPQGNLEPSAVTHAWHAGTQRHETDAEYDRRLEQDLRTSKSVIESQTGQPVRAIAWPYGAHNAMASAVAERVGLPYGFTLADGPVDARRSLSRIGRGYATYNLAVADYQRLLRAPALSVRTLGTQRIVHVDLDYVYDPDPAQQERNLSALIDRIHAIGPSAVYLQAFADPDGDGVAQALYFPNRHLPMRADLFGRAAWQLRTRAGVRVFAWMPVLAFQLPPGHPLADVTVRAHGAAASPNAPPRYLRLSPFDPRTRRLIGEIYDDLGRYAGFSGVLFHDDALLGDDEDASPAALDAYASWGLPRDIDAIRADPGQQARWATGKTRALTDFTLELAGILRRWQPDLLTARNLYARPVLEPAARAWFAQDFADQLTSYDYTAIMAMPSMEEADDSRAWLKALATAALAHPGAVERTVFELQARDWRTGHAVPDEQLRQQAAWLRQLGARHLAYYPDDFAAGRPGLATARASFSGSRAIQDELRRRLAPATPAGRPSTQENTP